ncbi:MAG: hypothetical protein II621_08835, partial [Clostridia bacterium]|nr:hypothetical protein [Clostridia bacterium]
YQNALNVKESFEENGITVSLDEVDIPNANTTGVVMSAVLTNDDGAQEKSISAFYENNGNLFSVNLKTTKLDNAETLFTEFLSAITYKPYRYFDEVTTTAADETATEAASETESTTAA